jgi:hypothetical protein
MLAEEVIQQLKNQRAIKANLAASKGLFDKDLAATVQASLETNKDKGREGSLFTGSCMICSLRASLIKTALHIGIFSIPTILFKTALQPCPLKLVSLNWSAITNMALFCARSRIFSARIELSLLWNARAHFAIS